MLSKLSENKFRSLSDTYFWTCYRHLGSQLAEMEKVIDKMMQEDFVRYATADLNRPLSEGADVPEEVMKVKDNIFPWNFFWKKKLNNCNILTQT